MLFGCFAPAALMAQASTGSMSGTVTDPNGASVPAAKVVATNIASGLKTETQTSDAGIYVFPRLPVGVYDISVQKTEAAVPATVDHAVALGSVVRLELSRHDNSEIVEVEMPRDRYEGLKLAHGSTVYLAPRKARFFLKPEDALTA